MGTTKAAHPSLVRNYLISYISLLTKRIKEEIYSYNENVDIDEGWILEKIKKTRSNDP